MYNRGDPVVRIPRYGGFYEPYEKLHPGRSVMLAGGKRRWRLNLRPAFSVQSLAHTLLTVPSTCNGAEPDGPRALVSFNGHFLSGQRMSAHLNYAIDATETTQGEHRPSPKYDSGREFVFVVGGIASGKNSVVQDRLQGYSYLDIDTLCVHPRDFNAPPEVLEEFDRGGAVEAFSKTMQWAIDLQWEWMEEKLRLGAGNYVYMSTGRRREDLAHAMETAKANGYTVVLIHVRASEESRLHRNQGRERSIVEHRVIESGRDAEAAYAALSPLADRAEVVDNDPHRANLFGQSSRHRRSRGSKPSL